MGSLFAALTTAVSGLTAQSSAIGNISDNLANAQSVGYKSVGTSFEELVNASNAAVNNPGGVTATPQYQNDVQGSIVSSNVTTNLAISGEGYFATETASTDASGGASGPASTPASGAPASASAAASCPASTPASSPASWLASTPASFAAASTPASSGEDASTGPSALACAAASSPEASAGASAAAS